MATRKESKRYIFGNNGNYIEHTIYKPWSGYDCSQISVNINGEIVWFKSKDYIKQMKKLVQDYEKYNKD